MIKHISICTTDKLWVPSSIHSRYNLQELITKWRQIHPPHISGHKAISMIGKTVLYDMIHTHLQRTIMSLHIPMRIPTIHRNLFFKQIASLFVNAKDKIKYLWRHRCHWMLGCHTIRGLNFKHSMDHPVFIYLYNTFVNLPIIQKTILRN